MEQDSFEVLTTVGVPRHTANLLQRPRQLSALDRLPQGSWTAKVTVGQQFDVANAQTLVGQDLHEPFDLRRGGPVQAHERPQRVHVGVDRELAAQEEGLKFRAHFPQQALPHADPGLAAGDRLGDFHQAQMVDAQEFDHELRLLEDAQGLLGRRTDQADDGVGFVRPQGDVGQAMQRQLTGTTPAFETVQQQATVWRVDPFQGLLDAPFGDRGQPARFATLVPQAVAFKSRVETGQFHGFVHRSSLGLVPKEGVAGELAERSRCVADEPSGVVSEFGEASRAVRPDGYGGPGSSSAPGPHTAAAGNER